MHVLTKLFVVLVTLLAVLLVPLVVVYAYNENSFQQKYQDSTANAAAARTAFEAAKATHGAAMLRKDSQIQQLDSGNSELRRLSDRQETEVRQLQTRLAEAENMDDEIRAQISTLTSSVDAGQKLNQTLIEELRGLRRDALTSERQKVELDEALRDTIAKLDAAQEARRALQEELQRIKEENAQALDTIAQMVAAGAQVPTQTRTGAGVGARPVDHDLTATVIAVRRNADQVFAEIDAGSRDGVREGWVLTIGDGGNFVGRLRIVEVDINRATGIVELEDEYQRGRVEVGHRAIARRQ